MKKIYLIGISMMLLATSCQKETQVANPQTGVTQLAKTTKNNTGSVLGKLGTQNVSNFDSEGEAIGWFIDLTGYGTESMQNQSGPVSSNWGPASSYCSGINTVTMYAGQNIAMGTISYANDATNLYVTYQTNADWFISEAHLYVGTLTGVPKSGGGTPTPGKFTVNQTFTASTLKQYLTYTIPLSSLPTGASLVIAAHAAVIQIESSGDIVSKETAWSYGPRFTSSKSWATYTPISIASCDGGGGLPGDFHATKRGNQ